MDFIYKWEGGCADHPSDPGGRTYKGITTARARQSGWIYDVCSMPDNQVDDIYREDYWPRASKFEWPLCLAVMNTEVNSGGGKAQEFLNRSANIEGTLERALAVCDLQTEYYRDIVKRKPTMKVFLAGWLNRAEDLRRTILS